MTGITSEMAERDLEYGCCVAGDGGEEEEEEGGGGSCFFSDGEESSCNSQFFSTGDGDFCYDDCSLASGVEIFEDEEEDLESGRGGIDVEINGDSSKTVEMKRVDRNCRICHLSLVSCSPGAAVSAAIELGCSCKDDLAAAHKQCAETWFKIRGNKTCEICNSVARNVVGANDIEAGGVQGSNESGGAAASGAVAAVGVGATAATTETPSCFNGHRFLNFLLACMVFAFVISWLFHFNIPS